MENQNGSEEIEEVGDISVPTDLLELYVELEEQGVTPEDFKRGFSDENS